MFPYSDPSQTGLLEKVEALDPYRSALHAEYVGQARLSGSAFTLLEVFDAVQSEQVTINWRAFPRLSSTTSHGLIDRDRFELQDEYVEWHVEHIGDRPSALTFTTEFPEFYMACAAVSRDAVIEAIQAVYPGASPSDDELFGRSLPSAVPSSRRVQLFHETLQKNPWVNGAKGILCLAHQSNTLGALFGLIGPCAVPVGGPANAVCSSLDGACVPGRNSDPVVCSAAQEVSRRKEVLSLADPAGVQMLRLEGIWKLGGKQIDINDPIDNQEAWIVSRNGRRAVLDLTTGVTIGDDPIVSGAQVATQLSVGATVVVAPESDVPGWARTGQESSRAIV